MRGGPIGVTRFTKGKYPFPGDGALSVRFQAGLMSL